MQLKVHRVPYLQKNDVKTHVNSENMFFGGMLDLFFSTLHRTLSHILISELHAKGAYTLY